MDNATPAPAAAEAEKPAEKPAEKSSKSEVEKRHAVYDLTHGRFVGPVLGKKPTKTEAAKLVPTGHDFEIREV